MSIAKLLFFIFLVYLNTIIFPSVQHSLYDRFKFKKQAPLCWAFIILFAIIIGDIYSLIKMFDALLHLISAAKSQNEEITNHLEIKHILQKRPSSNKIETDQSLTIYT